MSRRSQRDLFAQQRDRPVLGPHFLGEVFDLIGARDERRQVEAEGVLDLRPPALFGRSVCRSESRGG